MVRVVAIVCAFKVHVCSTIGLFALFQRRKITFNQSIGNVRVLVYFLVCQEIHGLREPVGLMCVLMSSFMNTFVQYFNHLEA